MFEVGCIISVKEWTGVHSSIGTICRSGFGAGALALAFAEALGCFGFAILGEVPFGGGDPDGGVGAEEGCFGC